MRGLAGCSGRFPQLVRERAAVHRLSEVHDACTLSVVAAPEEFEPRLSRPPNVRFVGPILDGPPLMKEPDRAPALPSAEPTVVVSFSTSHQGQLPVLQRFVSALESLPARAIVTTGPAIDPASLPTTANAQVVRFVPHDRLLPHASLVVTHAGLGTVMMALAHGVPMLCAPLGRDQFFNASRVEALGVGGSSDEMPMSMRSRAPCGRCSSTKRRARQRGGSRR